MEQSKKMREKALVKYGIKGPKNRVPNALGGPSSRSITPTASLSNGNSSLPSSSPKSIPSDPSMAAKFIFKNENAKPGAYYLEARSLPQVVEKDAKDNYQETGYRLLSTQHRLINIY